MPEPVKPPSAQPRGQRQVARTETRVVAAATRLFLERGYIATTLVDVAEAADVGERTIYVRFGSKALLFKRVVDVAIVGDTAPIDVLSRDWMQLAFTETTLDGRIRALAAAGRQILERTGALFAVAQQAAAVEPLVEEFWQQGREQSRRNQQMVWTRMGDDGLLPPACDPAWTADTASILTSPETYLLITRMMGWDMDTYEAWLVAGLHHMSNGSGRTSNAPIPPR